MCDQGFKVHSQFYKEVDLNLAPVKQWVYQPPSLGQLCAPSCTNCSAIMLTFRHALSRRLDDVRNQMDCSGLSPTTKSYRSSEYKSMSKHDLGPVLSLMTPTPTVAPPPHFPWIADPKPYTPASLPRRPCPISAGHLLSANMTHIGMVSDGQWWAVYWGTEQWTIFIRLPRVMYAYHCCTIVNIMYGKLPIQSML